jgi:hypothetical protein
MAKGPKEIEETIERMLNAWETLAPDKTFGGMTFPQFRAVALVAQLARRRIDDLENQLKQAIAERDAADDTFLEKVQLVVNGIRADATEGPDSALYQSFGYTKKSDRKSGLTRKRTSTK